MNSMLVESKEAQAQKGNLYKVAFVGLSFTMLFTAYIVSQNLVTQIYKEYGYNGLGQACVLTIFLSQGVVNLFASHIKRKLTHRQGLVLGGIGYASFVVIGAFTTSCNRFDMDVFLCERPAIYALNISISVFVGFGAGILWLTQADYVNLCADDNTKGFFNGVFWTLMQMSQIIGSVLATFVLGSTDPFTFYMILLVFGAISIVMLAFTPRLEAETKQADEKSHETLLESMDKFRAALICKKGRFMLVPMFLIGIIITFYASSLSTIIDATLNSNDNNFVNEHMGFVLIALAVGEVAAGVSIGRIADMVDKIKLLHAMMVIPEIALIATIAAYKLESYGLGLIAGFLWGFCDTALNSMMTIIIGAFFGGQLEFFCIMRCLTGFGGVLGAGLILLLTTSQIFLYILIIAGCFLALHMTFLYLSAKTPKVAQEDAKQSLVTNL